MKTLQQIEPRIAVNSSNTPGDSSSVFIITNAGSYYLTGNLTTSGATNGITINAPNVFLDLGGFALVGGFSGLGDSRGVNILNGSSNVCVQNGSLQHWGDTGIYANNSIGTMVREVFSSDNGQLGLYLGRASLVVNCVVHDNGRLVGGPAGIKVGPGSIIRECTSRDNNGRGFEIDNNCSIESCAASGTAFGGIVVNSNCLVSGNTLTDCGTGIILNGSGNRVVNNICNKNFFYGIEMVGSGNHIDGNTLVANNELQLNTRGGIYGSGGTRNLIIRNMAKDNGINYNFSGAQAYGTLIVVITGGEITNLNPWANFVY